MTTVPKVVSLLAISVALTLSGSPVFAKNGGGPSQVTTSGTSAAHGGNPAGGSVERRPAGCGHKHSWCVRVSSTPGSHERQRSPRCQPGTRQPHPSPEIGITAQ